VKEWHRIYGELNLKPTWAVFGQLTNRTSGLASYLEAMLISELQQSNMVHQVARRGRDGVWSREAFFEKLKRQLVSIQPITTINCQRSTRRAPKRACNLEPGFKIFCIGVAWNCARPATSATQQLVVNGRHLTGWRIRYTTVPN
jgi:hypothetical protein